MASQPAQFDLAALYEAVDAHRLQRGLTWLAAAVEIGLPLTTLRAIQHAKTMEADGVLAIVRWLGIAPEEFMRPKRKGRFPNTMPAGKMWRADTARLYALLQAAKDAHGLTWTDIASAIGTEVSPSSLTRLAKGGRISINLLAALAAWLNEPIDAFTTLTDQ